MINLTKKQIEEVKKLQSCSNTSFHGNRKKINGVPVKLIKEIVEKKRQREKGRATTISIESRVKKLLAWSLECKGTNYYKILIEGNTGIYYASPVYLHADYNKKRVFDKNEKTLKLMNLFNKILSKK